MNLHPRKLVPNFLSTLGDPCLKLCMGVEFQRNLVPSAKGQFPLSQHNKQIYHQNHLIYMIRLSTMQKSKSS